MKASTQNFLSSITGNIPKAILCVRQVTAGDTLEDTVADAAALQKQLLQTTKGVLQGGDGAASSLSREGVQTFSSLTSAASGAGGIASTQSLMAGSGYVAMEVQYNPNAIYMDTQAGQQVQYSGGNLGNQSNNQLVQVYQPVSTTMSFQLIFDDMNPSDAFMLENIAPTAGNAVSGISSIAKKAKGGGYSVQKQIDGLMALLVQDTTRQVIFYWSRMCFRGELTSVNTRYTMFNKDGNPIRGVVELSIRQGDEVSLGYDEIYWNEAFNKAFGEADIDLESGMKDTFTKVTNNNFLNLNL